jgi:signal transduction histidine kinase
VVVVLAGDRQASEQLLDAVISVSRDLRLREVLQRIVEYACQLVEARFGALGVAGPDDVLVDVIYQGVDESEIAAIGTPPAGTGLLGHLIRNPVPLRLDDLTEHPAASGFPSGHAPMRTFLGVPLMIRDEVFGALFLTEKVAGGSFTEADELTLVSLATAAGIAVDNARMYERSRQRERWLQASNEITTALLAEAHPMGELKLVTRLARTVAGAPVAAIALPDERLPDKLVFEVVDGLRSDTNLAGMTVDVGSSGSGQVFSTGKPLLIDNYGAAASAWQDENNGGAPSRLREMGSAAIVPLAAGEQILGVLLLIRLRTEPAFADDDLELLQNFAAHAAIALQYARAKADQRRLAVFEDRDRIAGDIQDLVIRRLFEVGLGLQSVSRLVSPELRWRVAGLVDELDGTIRDLRRSIFSLHERFDPDVMPGTLDEEVRRTVRHAEEALGFEARMRLAGPLDAVVPGRLRPDLLATLREALANVARHAVATTVTVELRADQESGLQLDVVDDGVGIPAKRGRNSGLANLGRRAEKWGGKLVVKPVATGGTRLTWTVPLLRD